MKQPCRKPISPTIAVLQKLSPPPIDAAAPARNIDINNGVNVASHRESQKVANFYYKCSDRAASRDASFASVMTVHVHSVVLN